MDYPDSGTDAVSVTLNGLLQSVTSKTGVATTFGYDELRRRETVQEAHKAYPTITEYHPTSGRVSKTRVQTGESTYLDTVYAYDSAGHCQGTCIPLPSRRQRCSFQPHKPVVYCGGSPWDSVPIPILKGARRGVGAAGRIDVGFVDIAVERTTVPDQDVIGALEVLERGDGFLRSAKRNYAVNPQDPVVRRDVINRFGLRGGETIEASTRSGGNGKRRPGGLEVAEIRSVNDMEPGAYAELTEFNDLTVVDPHSRIRFETEGGPTTMRVIDLMTPIGAGQRGLIAAPPRTGKTILLQQMAAGIAANHPDIYMMVLLIDERPEEVTEMRRSVHGEVVASSNDHDIASHVRIARLMIARAKRMVECGKDALILLDSLTRLGRAFNAFIRSSGRTMSGGLDIRAMAEPKAMFGAARKIENGGSLTILATALIDTGSRMDELIFNEFKGTGNMEIMLCRELANKRIWPAMDLHQSGTRKEELLLSPEALEQSIRIRRRLHGMAIDQEMLMLTEALEKYPTNQAFLAAQAK